MDAGIAAGLLLIRLAVGAVMFFHGTQKLLGWFGGDGLSGATDFFARLGYRPPRVMAVIAAVVETAGGMLLALGWFTEVAAVLLIASLLNVVLVHVRNGFDRRRNGFEYEFVLLCCVVAVAVAGPGPWSIDALLGVDLAGLVRGAVGLDLGGVSGLLAIAAGIAGGAIAAVTRQNTARPSRTDLSHVEGDCR